MFAQTRSWQDRGEAAIAAFPTLPVVIELRTGVVFEGNLVTSGVPGSRKMAWVSRDETLPKRLNWLHASWVARVSFI